MIEATVRSTLPHAGGEAALIFRGSFFFVTFMLALYP
jgi:hypothetical protein